MDDLGKKYFPLSSYAPYSVVQDKDPATLMQFFELKMKRFGSDKTKYPKYFPQAQIGYDENNSDANTILDDKQFSALGVVERPKE